MQAMGIYGNFKCNLIVQFMFCTIVQGINILEWTRNQRPNSKWVFHSLTQTLITVTKLNFVIGHPTELPSYIKNNDSIIALTKNSHTGMPYDDNLCLFRCITLHQGKGERSFQRATIKFFI